MKPRYIFVAVFAICALMFIGLPQIAHSSRAANAYAAAPVNAGGAASVAAAALNASPASPTPIPTLPPITQQANQPTAAVPPTAVAQPTATKAAQPAVKVLTSTPVGGGQLPSPADPSAAPGQGQAPAAIPATSGLPDLAAFTGSLSNGQASQVVGVYAPGLFAMPVVQQPNGDINYVSTTDQTVTQYSQSANFGTIGLLAHNTLSSGLDFYKLKPGQDVILIYGNGKQVHYRIKDIENYQAISPTDPYSDFIDLNSPGGQLVHNDDLFQRMYEVPGQLVFQTCFAANGNPSWGRRFIIAGPA